MKFLNTVDSIGIAQEPIGSPEALLLTYVSGSQLYVGAGRAVVGTGGSRAIAILDSALLKTLTVAWTAGSSQGGKFAGTVAANQTWHVFVIRNNATGVVDAGFDTSASGANIPTGWTGRIIGSIVTDGSSNIRNFVQLGDLFQWKVSVQDFNSSATPTNTANLLTLTVPTGILVTAFGRMSTYGTTGANGIYAATPGITADAIAYAAMLNTLVIGRFELLTNTSGQITFYVESANSFGQVKTWGFYHPRGAY